MRINSQTKVSEVIKHNKEAIEAIASLNPLFNKLRNPVLRSILAPRVTLQEASKIGKCDLTVLLNKLAELGFIIESFPQPIIEPIKDSKNLLNFIGERKISDLDVRPTLASNEDPFNLILSHTKSLDETNILKIIVSFEPIPLIRILQAKGFDCLTIEQDNVFSTYIKIGSGEQSDTLPNIQNCSNEEFQQKLNDFTNLLIEIDVRELEMPLPMVTILEEIENLGPDNALFVHHKKIPQYLLPELNERGFKMSIYEIEEGNVQLIIHR